VKTAHVWAAVVVALLSLAAVAGAIAASAASPENTARPTISGTPREGATLAATAGTWVNAPTSFAYKFQRCGSDGVGCGVDVQTSPRSKYVVTKADIGHTIRVVVTAVNADGKSDPTPSDATDVVSSKNGPNNTALPTISGDATQGQTITASAGSWSPAASSYTYQWQRCDATNLNCRNIIRPRTATYVPGPPDVGTKLRVLVTAHTANGDTTVHSEPTDFVQSNVVPTKVNEAPTLQFVSLVRIGRRVYARFRVCDDGLGRITVLERDTKIGAPAYARRYSVYTYASCGTFSRSWAPAPRFRTRGRLTVTLQAIDKSQKKSATRAKNVYQR
jgi:hypothetical protein